MGRILPNKTRHIEPLNREGPPRPRCGGEGRGEGASKSKSKNLDSPFSLFHFRFMGRIPRTETSRIEPLNQEGTRLRLRLGVGAEILPSAFSILPLGFMGRFHISPSASKLDRCGRGPCRDRGFPSSDKGWVQRSCRCRPGGWGGRARRLSRPVRRRPLSGLLPGSPR